MYKLGLIGKDISHSKSKASYEKLLKKSIDFDLLDFKKEEDIPDLESVLKSYNGLSVTSPYKKVVYEMCNSHEEVRDFKAINCLKLKDGIVYGTNTDYYACLEILEDFRLKGISEVLLLGDGSMSRVLSHALKKLGIPFSISSRKIDEFKQVLSKNTHRDLLINCCARDFDLSSLSLSKSIHLWDLNYNQAYEDYFKKKLKTQFLNGESLLLKQAKLAINYWEIS